MANDLVGGWQNLPLWNIWVNWDDEIFNIWENKRCSSHHQPAVNQLSFLALSNVRKRWVCQPAINFHHVPGIGTEFSSNGHHRFFRRRVSKMKTDPSSNPPFVQHSSCSNSGSWDTICSNFFWDTMIHLNTLEKPRLGVSNDIPSFPRMGYPDY